MDTNKRFNQLEEIMADMLIQQNKTVEVLERMDKRMEQMDKRVAYLEDNSMTSGAFNNFVNAMLDVFERLEKNATSRFEQVNENAARQEKLLERIADKIEKTADYEERIIRLEKVVFKVG